MFPKIFTENHVWPLCSPGITALSVFCGASSKHEASWREIRDRYRSMQLGVYQSSRVPYKISWYFMCIYIYIRWYIYIYMSCSWKKEKQMINERIYTYNIYTYKSQFFSQHYPVNQPKLWERGALKRCSQLTYVIYYVSIWFIVFSSFDDLFMYLKYVIYLNLSIWFFISISTRDNAL